LLRADVPAIHVFSYGNKAKAWMPGIKAGMTNRWIVMTPDSLMVRDARLAAFLPDKV
jgi:hypothetical protein